MITALTACQSPEKATNVKEVPSTELTEENTTEETLRASAIEKSIYGYYQTMITLHAEDMFSYLAFPLSKSTPFWKLIRIQLRSKLQYYV